MFITTWQDKKDQVHPTSPKFLEDSVSPRIFVAAVL